MSEVSATIEQQEPLPAVSARRELHADNGGLLAELWRYRELLYFLAWRDVKVRYKQASLGAAWAIIQPLFTMLVFTLFFGRLAKIPSDGIPYALFTYCALVPWTYFSGTLSQAGNSLVANSDLISKVYFPRILLPAASALSGLLDFLISTAFVGVLMFYYGVKPGWSLLLWPLAVIEMVVVTVGTGMALAALNVHYRDVKYAISFLIQLGLFVTPVIYPINFMPARLRFALALNPLSGVIETFRTCFFSGRTLDLRLAASSAVVAILLFVLGAVYFHKTERTFADVI